MRLSRRSFTLDASFHGSGFMGLTGDNGSGKSTLLHIISGFITPDSGNVAINGRDVTALPMQQRSAVYINPDTWFAHMDVDAHMSWGLKFSRNNTHRSAIDEIRERLSIGFSGKVGSLSAGQRSRVILGTALAANPDVILIDEVLSSISQRQPVLEYISEFSFSNKTDIILVSHDRMDLMAASALYMMEDGRLVKE